MPVPTVSKSKPISTKHKSLSVKTQKKSSVQPQFASSKLIQNLGSENEEYMYIGKIRNTWGRD